MHDPMIESEAVMTQETSGTDISSTLSRLISEKADKIKYAVLVAVILLVIIFVALTLIRRSTVNREAEAENRMFQTMVDLERAPESDAMAMFAKVAADYPGLPAASRAEMARFAYAYNTRDYVTAEQAARDYLKNFANGSHAPGMRLGLAQSLLMQGKNAEAATMLRDLVSREIPEIFPEAKLALAQALELSAEAAQDDPADHRRLLEQAAAEYNDIIVRSQITVPSQRGFWPQAVTLPAQFSLAVIKDQLIGYKHPEPASADAPLTEAEREAVMSIPPPANPESPVGASGDPEDGEMPAPPGNEAETGETAGTDENSGEGETRESPDTESAGAIKSAQ